MSAFQKATRSVPIVFVEVIDPVGGSLVASLAQPGGNTTGFLSSEFGFSGKWLELLKEIAPMVTRVAVMRDSAIASQIGMFGGIQSVAPSLGVELRPIDIRDAGEMERAVVAFAGEPNVGLIKPDIMRKWLDRGEIRSLLRRERQIWRDAICAGNESALQRIRDNSDNGIAVLSRRRVVPAANRAMQKATPSAEDLGEC